MGSLMNIISAWSWGVPVVAISIVAEGLKGEPDKHLSLCLRIAKDDELAVRLSEESYEFVLRGCDVKFFVDGFERWLKESFI